MHSRVIAKKYAAVHFYETDIFSKKVLTKKRKDGNIIKLSQESKAPKKDKKSEKKRKKA